MYGYKVTSHFVNGTAGKPFDFVKKQITIQL